MDSISIVKFGDEDSLKAFLFENGVQHKTFYDTLALQGKSIPDYPIMDADPHDLDDWLLAHQQMHQGLSVSLTLTNPINLLDADWNDEASFYDWLSTHLELHQQIVTTLGLT